MYRKQSLNSGNFKVLNRRFDDVANVLSQSPNRLHWEHFLSVTPEWPYKAGADKGYPVRTLSVGSLKKEEEDSIELPIVNPVPTWSFEILGEK